MKKSKFREKYWTDKKETKVKEEKEIKSEKKTKRRILEIND